MTKNERFLVCLSLILNKSKTDNKKRIWGGRSTRNRAIYDGLNSHFFPLGEEIIVRVGCNADNQAQAFKSDGFDGICNKFR